MYQASPDAAAACTIGHSARRKRPTDALKMRPFTLCNMPDGRPVFYFDLGSPYAYLAAERVNSLLPMVPVWQPVLLGAFFQARGYGLWSLTADREAGMAEGERRDGDRGLREVPWPGTWPGNALA